MAEPKARRWGAEQSDGNEMYLFAINKTIVKKTTAIQDVEIVDTPNYGYMLLLDGMIQSSEDDEHTYHEALVHPGLIAHANPREVLIIGGGEGATLREVLRYRSVERVTMVDIDGELIELCKEHLDDWHQNSFDDPRAEVVITDGRAFLETTDRTFDVVISDVTDLLDHGPAMRLYTREFYELLSRRLNPGGVLIVQALETSTSDWEEHAMLVRTIGQAFSNVRSYTAFIPSFIYTWGFLTASDTVDPAQLTKEEVDARIAARLTSELRSYDGVTHQGLFSLAKDLRALLSQPGPILEDATIESWAIDDETDEADESMAFKAWPERDPQIRT
jgi:spermidine synthase